MHVRRTAPAFLAGAVLAATSVSAGGCAGLHVVCTAAQVSVASVSASWPYGHFALTAKVTAGSAPVADAPVNFWVDVTGSGLPKGFTEAIGTVKTDATGLAKLDEPEGFFGDVLPGYTVTGYFVQFIGGTKVAGVSYCGVTTSSAAVKCGGSETCGPIPPMSEGVQ